MIIGSAISHYRIVEKLGEGGMGVVYKAEDTTLERAVALKFLADHLLNDDEAKQRFLREAKAAAALHHPNVCPVYEIDEVDGKTFLAMAFLEGESLEERIAEGPLSIKDALDIARQVADGLEAAHEKGIFHRDIKPANIMVDAKGRATIMDFGLARLTEASRLTKVDTAMGTVAYMSPEQAQGMEVDSRTDIWALGCVLYEMVSGQRPFQGQYDQALLYEIVHEEVAPLTSIRAGVPMELEFVVGECLAKDRDDRTGTAQEVSRKLRTLAEKLKSGHSTILQTTQMTGAVPATAMTGQTLNPAEALPPGAFIVRQRNYRILQGLAAVLVIALLGGVALHLSEGDAEQPDRVLRRFSLSAAGVYGPEISPDGRYILYRGEEGSLWLRSLAAESVRRLEGTEGAIGSFWSPDSLAVAFATGDPEYELKRISIDGGEAITLCRLPSRTPQAFQGGTWSPDGERIVFGSLRPLYEIDARGGEPTRLGDTRGRSPHFLPTTGSPQALVYTNRGQLMLYDSATGDSRDLGTGQVAIYAPEGFLIHHPADRNEEGLWALPFSLETLEPTGASFPISATGSRARIAQDGTLVYVDSLSARLRQLAIRDRSGEILRRVGEPSWTRASNLEVSPDGRHVAFESQGAVWVYDLDRDIATSLTSGGGRLPAWHSSGSSVSYAFRGDLMSRPADGSVDARLLMSAPGLYMPQWSRDDRYLIYSAAAPAGEEAGLWYREAAADGSLSGAVSFLRTPASENSAVFSPDGRYVAYHSDESGVFEVYVRPFPSGQRKWQVSVGGGGGPRWSPTGKELFYTQDASLMAVPVSLEPSFTPGRPQSLFETGGAPTLDGMTFFPTASTS